MFLQTAYLTRPLKVFRTVLNFMTRSQNKKAATDEHR